MGYCDYRDLQSSGLYEDGTWHLTNDDTSEMQQLHDTSFTFLHNFVILGDDRPRHARETFL